MSMIHKYTVDALGFVPHLWQIWRDPALGPVRCVAVEGLGRKGGVLRDGRTSAESMEDMNVATTRRTRI